MVIKKSKPRADKVAFRFSMLKFVHLLPTRMNRRKFIVLSALAATSMVLPWLIYRNHKISLVTPQLIDYIKDKQVLQTIGLAYRKLFPRESTKQKLTALILQDATLKSSFFIQSFLRKKVRDDFANGRMVTIEGWILSVTEVRQCALYSYTINHPHA
jgi:hypothetical protein